MKFNQTNLNAGDVNNPPLTKDHPLVLAALFAQSALAELRAGRRDGATMGKCSQALDRLTEALGESGQ